jgi:two-component system, sensor histidine kinase and response regulator
MAKGNILVVEDDEDLVHMLTYNLSKRGYQTTEALDGMCACRMIEAAKPDLILLDILLPGLDGWQICKIIRNHHQEGISEIPIIMLTALGSNEDKLKGIEIGADDYIPKPFSIKEVMCKVDRLILREMKNRSLKAKIEKLVAMENRRTDFQNMLFHELKNQLAIIGGYSMRIAENRALTPEKYQHCAGVISECSSSLDALTQEVLLLLRLESGDLSLPLEEVSVEKSVQKTISGLSKHAEDKGIHIRFECTGNVAHIPLNATAIKFALGNIIENAIKYSPEQSVITVRTELKDAKGIVIEVEDRGQGIPEEEREKIFDRFYRGDNVKDNTKGMGLGLYISKTLIELMGGAIQVRSGEKSGTCFTVSLPLAQARQMC